MELKVGDHVLVKESVYSPHLKGKIVKVTDVRGSSFDVEGGAVSFSDMCFSTGRMERVPAPDHEVQSTESAQAQTGGKMDPAMGLLPTSTLAMIERDLHGMQAADRAKMAGLGWNGTSFPFPTAPKPAAKTWHYAIANPDDRRFVWGARGE